MASLPVGFEVRRAEASEAGAAADVWLRSRHASVPAIPAPVHTDDEVREWFRDVVVPNREVWVVAAHDGALAAVLVLEPGWIDQLHVDPSWFDRGLGSVLVDLAKERQPDGLDLWTFATNVGARRFYERHGFVAVDATADDNEEGEPDVRYRWPAGAAPAGALTAPYRPMPVALDTERLALRLRDPSDATWNVRLLAERDGGPKQTLPDVRARLEEQARAAAVDGFGFLTIRRRDDANDADPLGYCGLLVGRATFDEPELAYELFRREHGNGYATEAAAAVVAAAATTGRARLWATIRSWNGPSLRVAEKLGFARDHVTHDDEGEIVWFVRDLRDG